LITRCTQPRTLALTFDDGPNENTDKILDLLADYHAYATFFINGNTNGDGQIDITPQWAKTITRMVTGGHHIGSHTWSHVHMNNVTSTERKNEMWKNERAIANIIGRFPAYMRPPYLQCSEQSGCLEDMKNLGYHIIGFDVDSIDTEPGATLESTKRVMDAAFAARGANDSMLVVQHEHTPFSYDLTKYIIEEAYQKD
jgi:peptidoglycan/xylan/chitin deacetylase (PgdA/CDA1 family)